MLSSTVKIAMVFKLQAIMKQQITIFLDGFSIVNIHFSITFKVFTSDEQLKSKLHLTRHMKIHENNNDLDFFFIIQKWHT